MVRLQVAQQDKTRHNDLKRELRDQAVGGRWQQIFQV